MTIIHKSFAEGLLQANVYPGGLFLNLINAKSLTKNHIYPENVL